MNILIKETWVNKTENYNMGESGLYETFTDNKKELFASLQSEYGRCVSSMYINDNQRIGWVFEKMVPSDNSKGKFILETWVSLHTDYDRHNINHYYDNI